MPETKQHPQMVVFTDLDGTLLDHHTYSYQPANDALAELRRRGIPCVMNTSKTLAELLDIRAQIGNRDPMVAENGSGIAVPDEFPLELPQQGVTQDARGFRWITLGTPREQLVDVVQSNPHGFEFLAYSDMSPEDLMEITGLGLERAQQSLDRQFTEPLLWRDSAEAFEVFAAWVAAQGLQCLRGGRFVHVMGQTDKGKALSWLATCFKQSWNLNLQDPREMPMVALGDSHNDVAMLKSADIAVLVRSPVQDYPVLEHPGWLIRTEEFGPSGWNSALFDILQHLDCAK